MTNSDNEFWSRAGEEFQQNLAKSWGQAMQTFQTMDLSGILPGAEKAANKITSEKVSAPQLNALEKVIDRVFSKIGIDVEFTNHFIQRVNDARNERDITVQDLGQLFAKEYKRWGKAIANLNPNAEAVMKDLSTDVNIPFVIKKQGDDLQLIAKTVMAKKNFKTPNKKFPVERQHNEN